MNTKKRSKLIATIGPSSEKKEIIKELFDAGVTTIRLNFSHGDYEKQGQRIKYAKEIIKETQLPLSILLDTKGPEIRIGKMKDGEQLFNANQKIQIFTDNNSYKNKICSNTQLTVSYDMSKDLKPGKYILVDDGKLKLKVIDVEPGLINVETQNSHIIKTNKRINLPGTKFSMPFLAKKDYNDIKFGIKLGIDFIAASFVNSKENVEEIRTILKKENATHIQIFAKIESQYGVDNLDEILESADGIMIARGDLGLEIPYYEVPVEQKMIIRKSRKVGKPVIVATQMLDSMEKNPSPTRSEVTDVYHATELGADATMLSGETAIGKYPIITTRIMSTINERAEKEFFNKNYYFNYLKDLPKPKNKREEIAKLVTNKAKNGEYKFTVVLSRTGKLLTQIAKLRPNTNILGVTNDPKQTTQFGITFSVFMDINVENFAIIKANHAEAKKVVFKYGAKPGDKYLVVENDSIDEYVL
jgi:pyruvate kinase